MISRYSIITQGWSREILLLKSTPCIWGKCTFCDYIKDNNKDANLCHQENMPAILQVTGKYQNLEIINSGSCFEIPEASIIELQKIVNEKKISTISFESHWIYRNKFDLWKAKFPNTKVIMKVGIESFDDKFRQNFLKKGADFNSEQDLEEIKKYCDSICLLVGIKGQTKEMIKRDIKILTENFKLGCVNIFVENSCNLKSDPELISWFKETYGTLDEFPKIDVLYHNEDFGVFAN